MSDAPTIGSSTFEDGTDPRIAEILDIVAKETGVDRTKLVPQAVITDLEIASLDLVQTIFAIEERYKIDIPVVAEQTGSEFQTVGDLVQHVIATLDKAAGDKATADHGAATSPPPGNGQSA